MRTYDFYGSHKEIPSNGPETIIFSANEVPSRGLVELYVGLGVTAATGFDNVTGVIVRADGVPIVDLSNAQLSTYQGRFSKSNFSSGAARQSFSIPLCILDPESGAEEDRDVCQFPPGAQITVEINVNGAVANDDLWLGWAQNFDVAPQYHPRRIGIPANVPASTVGARYNLPGDRGMFRAIAFPLVGVVRASLYLNERRILHMPGPVFRANGGSMLSETQLGLGQLTAGGTNPDPVWLKFNSGQPVVPGASYLELETDGTWAGVTNEVATDILVPV